MTLAVLAVASYVVLGLVATTLVVRARQRMTPPLDDAPFASIIVAARNEEASIGDCIEALRLQDYPADRLEIIVVDDASTDATAAIIREAAARDERLRYLSTREIPRLPPGKAAALQTGAAAARGAHLLLTDADCRPPEEWVRGMVSALSFSGVGIVGGVTRVEGNSLHARLQAIDWTLLKGVAAGWSLAGLPLTAMGNNLAVRRDAYDEVGGFQNLPPSVTEDFALFQAVGRADGWTARLDPRPGLENRTLPEKSFRDVFRQRRRWARGALAASPLATAFYIIVYAAHLLPLLLLATAPWPALMMIGAKMLTDAVVVAGASARGRRLQNLVLMPVYELYLYAYLLVLPVSLAVVPDIRWKGRAYHSQSTGSGQ